jgi:hypothetical protein
MKHNCLLVSRFVLAVIFNGAMMLSGLAKAENVELIDTIKGNLQHPNVLFIVPWQTPAEKIPTARKMAIRLPDYLTQPVERAEFVEQVVLPRKL